jgi:hypothetical protein
MNTKGVKIRDEPEFSPGFDSESMSRRSAADFKIFGQEHRRSRLLVLYALLTAWAAFDSVSTGVR